MSAAKQRSVFPIVVAHYLASALSFILLAVLLLYAVKELNGHYFHPKLLAITHLAGLGWATLIIFGACYQLIPVVFETDLSSFKLPWLSFGLFVGGLAALVCAFWTFDPGFCMQLGGLLLLSGILVFVLIVLQTARKNPKKAGIQQEFIVTSSLWLLATAVLGVLMVFNFRFAFLPQDHLHFLRLHAHLGLAGWFLLLIIGVSAKLIPMFLVSKRQDERFLTYSYYLINSALILFLIDTYLNNLNFKTYFIGLLLFLGIVSYLVYVLICFRTRIKQQIDLPIAHTILSLILLTASVLVIPFIIHGTIKNDPGVIHYTVLYGTLIFMGWITSLILGQAFKTLPFIVWVIKYEHLSGKTKIPSPADLYKKSLLKFQTLCFVLFCCTFYPGFLLRSQALMITGLVFLAITALIYIANLLIVLLHKSTVRYDKL